MFKYEKITYPNTFEDTSVVDNYHGTLIGDPYRWLEDDHAVNTKKWVEEQNVLTKSILDKIPYRKDIEERLTKIWNYDRYSSPFKEGEDYFYYKNDGLQNQAILYNSKDIKSEGEVFIDPNLFSDNGTTSLAGLSFNKSGDKVAYFISEGGSDWRRGFVMDVKSRTLTQDTLDWIKFSGISWAKDGFYYSRYKKPSKDEELSGSNTYHSLYYHQLGQNQEEDKLVFVDNKHPYRNVYAATTEDERFLIIAQVESTSGNRLMIKDLHGNDDIVTLVDYFDFDYQVLDNEGDNLLILTNEEAPRQKVISIDINNTDKENWKTLIPESENTIRNVSIVGNKIFVNYMEAASSKIKVYDMKGNFIQNLKLPGIGSTNGVSGKKSSNIGFYSFASFTTPSTIYKLNTETLQSEIFRKPIVDFDNEDYQTIQKWYPSKDGTKVPMFITMKKGTKLDGSNPTLLYGYGGFNIPLTPRFALTKIPLLENGGIYVVANIRGGGEFGKDWHISGTKENKQNVFDDFIAAAEYLIDNKYTSSDKLAIEGGSNGGLLVGACMTQRPELFAVAFPRVGVLDMLRYHKFTIGWAWATDYGKSDVQKEFSYLLAYSPLHNVKKQKYPSTMIMTADHDDRVVPAHSFKFAATLQKNQIGDNPVITRIDVSAGHGAGKPTSKSIEEAADLLSFMLFFIQEHYQPVN